MRPSLFKATLLGDVLKFFNGKSIKAGSEGEYPVYGSNGLIGRSDEYTHQNGVIIGRVGAYCGSVEYCKTHFWASDNTIVAQPKDISFDIRYIYYLLRDLNLNRHAGGSAQPLLTQTVLRRVQASIPPLSTQHKIAAILSPYDDLIANNTRRIQILEEMAQIIYRQWFVEFQFPGHENVPMVESELGMIPKGWEIGKLEDIVDNIRKTEKPGKHLEPLPYVPIDCISRRSIALMQHKPSREAKSSLIAFKRNDILFGAMRAYFHKVTFAPFDGITRKTCFVLRSKNPNNYPFDLFTIFQDSTVKYASNYSTGSTIPYATWDGALAVMPIVNPPDSLIQKFSDIVTPMLDSIRMLAMKNTNLRQTRDLLLPKLISGELDVSELDINIDGIQPNKGGTPIPSPLTERLHSDEKNLGGKPVIRGTRLAVAFIIELLENGWGEEEILENYPSINREDIDACLAYQQQGAHASVRK